MPSRLSGVLKSLAASIKWSEAMLQVSDSFSKCLRHTCKLGCMEDFFTNSPCINNPDLQSCGNNPASHA